MQKGLKAIIIARKDYAEEKRLLKMKEIEERVAAKLWKADVEEERLRLPRRRGWRSSNTKWS